MTMRIEDRNWSWEPRIQGAKQLQHQVAAATPQATAFNSYPSSTSLIPSFNRTRSPEWGLSNFCWLCDVQVHSKHNPNALGETEPITYLLEIWLIAFFKDLLYLRFVYKYATIFGLFSFIELISLSNII